MVKKTFYNVAGLAMPIAIAVGLMVLFMGLFLKLPPAADPVYISADTATTTVTVLNTPPNWTVDAQEYIESSTSSPTNAGNNVVWVGTGSDDNGERYYLLLCKTSSTPTANANTAPTCGGGAGNQWAVSASTTSGVQSTSTYTATTSDAESNEWFAWICDGSANNPACNGTFKQGTGTSSSPFVVNHRPNFTAITNDTPVDPGDLIQWTATASDTDVFGGADQVQLFACRASDFTGSACGAGGTYCTSTLAASNPSCSFTIPIPTQDQSYSAFTYIVDNHVFSAQGGAYASNSPYVVSNVAPTIASSTITFPDGDLTLTVPEAETTGFKFRATISDNNSCDAVGGGAADEISSILANVYRSGVGQASCDESSEYNPNRCYSGALPTSSWNIAYTASSTSCGGSSDTTIIWEATFPLWFLSDPTDGTTTNTQFSTHTWMASVRATDDDGATSTLIEMQTANAAELLSFLAFDVIQTSIVYGSLAPGSSTDPIVSTTTLKAIGNVGLDENLSGLSMCTTFPSCPVSTTSTIPETEQRYATSSVAYASATQLTTSSIELELDVQKSTATSSPATRLTNWGIRVPVSITLAGDYTGQNTIIAVTSEPGQW